MPHHEILTADEERELLILAQAGDMAARDRLVLCNQALVRRVAVRFTAYTRNWRADAVQCGNLGLLAAIDTFSTASPARFYSYARTCIFVAIRDEYRKTYRLVRTPRYLYASRLRSRVATILEPHSNLGESDLFLLDPTGFSEEIADADERRMRMHRVEQAMSMLNESDRQIVLMSARDNLSGEIISNRFGRSQSWVSNRLARAMTYLRLVLKEAS